MIVSMVPIGALILAILSKYTVRYFERRDTLIVTAILFIISTLFIVLASNISFVLAGRLLMGFAIGLTSMAAPMYLSEISPQQVRDSIIFLFQLAVTLGIMSAFIINYILQVLKVGAKCLQLVLFL